MDDSHKPIISNELDPRVASEQSSTVAEGLSAELARSRERAALSQPHHSDQINPRPNDLCAEDSIVVYCGSEEEVAQGFLDALLAMGVVEIEQPSQPEKPPLPRAKP